MDRFAVIGMIVVVGALVAIGHLAQKRQDDGALLITIGVALVVLAIARGYYWHIFPRGEGPWTANRVSALAVFIAAAIAVPLLRRRTGA